MSLFSHTCDVPDINLLCRRVSVQELRAVPFHRVAPDPTIVQEKVMFCPAHRHADVFPTVSAIGISCSKNGKRY